MSKLALLFPGQGSQYVGMLKSFRDHEIVRKVFDEAEQRTGMDFWKLCLDTPKLEQDCTDIAQIVIYVSSVALYRLVDVVYQPSINYMAGHSVGEYAALTCAGSLSFLDGLELVLRRGQLMKECLNGGMVAIQSVESDVLEGICETVRIDSGKQVFIAAYNNSFQSVISGDLEAIKLVMDKVKEKSGYAVPLPVSGAFHSSLMEPALQSYREYLNNCPFLETVIPVISNRTGRPFELSKLREHLLEQLIQPVRWHQTMEYLIKKQVSCFLEVGPKDVLRNMLQKDGAPVSILSVEKDFALIPSVLTPKPSLNNDEFQKLVMACIKAAVCTRNSNWNEEEYKEGVLKPYRQLQMFMSKTDNDVLSNRKNAEACLQELITIFETKGVTREEQAERIKEITGVIGEDANSLYIAVFKEEKDYSGVSN